MTTAAAPTTGTIVRCPRYPLTGQRTPHHAHAVVLDSSPTGTYRVWYYRTGPATLGGPDSTISTVHHRQTTTLHTLADTSDRTLRTLATGTRTCPYTHTLRQAITAELHRRTARTTD
ncbi:hypothetical protein ACFVVA_36950 [Kitasatospora sp. NPDC058048]|uniref:hypothetical protein n=1 Tax=Kitasatospora sp. NPDC058048 TaxID=3346313 RepID=UPI0036DB296C